MMAVVAIKQATAEDWIDSIVHVPTANPCFFGPQALLIKIIIYFFNDINILKHCMRQSILQQSLKKGRCAP